MRIGTNPLNRSFVKPPADKVIAAIVHLPNRTGYHERRFDVIRLCLTSMREHAGANCQVYIWDNGSCNEIRNWIANTYKPDYLTLSQNVGKSSARRAIFSSFPQDTIIGMSDDDVFFYPMWFEKQITILNHYQAIQVSGYPCRTSFRWGCVNTIKMAGEIGKVSRGRFLPDVWERDFAVSIGRDPDYHKAYSANDLDYRVSYKGVQAYCTGHHMQFVARAGKILPALSWSDEAMADEKPFDEAVDKLGMRLCTIERLSRHIGNVIDDGILSEAKRFNLL